MASPPAYSELPGFGPSSPFNQVLSALERQQTRGVDELFDENLMTAELKDFVNKVIDNKLKAEDYPAARLKMNFRRDPDGRVAIRSREGQWFRVKNDMEAPGSLLLQDSMGYVYFLPPDEEDGLEQLDLSDDVVVAELFSNTAWQDVMLPIKVLPEGVSAAPSIESEEYERAQQLQLTEMDFRLIPSLIAEAVDGPEDEAEERPALRR